MKDLEILAKDGPYREFLEHAKDILPRNRTAQWRQMVRNVSTKYLEEIINKRDFSTKIQNLVEDLSTWPELKKELVFKDLRRDYVIAYLKNCFFINPKDIKCIQKFDSFWKESSTNALIAQKLVPIAQEYMSEEKTYEFIHLMANDDLSSLFCNRPDVRNLIMKKAFKIFNDPQYDSRTSRDKKLFSIANQRCWKVITQNMGQELFDRYIKHSEFSYILLKLNNMIDQKLKERFLTYYILQSPIQGEVFDESWNQIKKLGNNFEQRQEMLEYLKGIDPLPGKSFAIKNIEQRKNIIRFISQNMPEYLDYYARTCIEFMTGKRDFPNGNPTVECRDLFSSVEGTSWVNQSLQIEFSKIRK
ncbi:MAG: hypothetical protein H6622_15525 [Halobacteriovoraceae bacterium]|nr:hypothetical protein [Halobacteriovoraceae bacterium]